MNWYPLSRCLNPRRIYNPYTKESMVVPCGHCSACALNRSGSLQLWCDLEAQSHEYCVFVTLTYANRYIPRAQLLDSIVRPFSYDLVTTDGEILSDCDITSNEVDSIRKKTYLFGDIPYLRKEDLQKFLKRFRYYVSKVSKSKVRYFACGEYGPVHYRPHFHILFYFSDKAILEVCEQSVLASWPFGRIDVQQSKGSVAQYVAGYVNSACALPKIYLSPAIRPFQVHSTKLGYGILQGERKEVYETSVDDFIQRSLVINGKYKEFSLWRAYYAYYYPKCKGFAVKSSSECINSYRIYDYARCAFPECKSVIELAKSIVSCSWYFGASKGSFQVDKETEKVILYFYDSVALSYGLDSEQIQRYTQRVYTELLLSRHFLYFVCDNTTYYEIVRKYKLIKQFYERLDYLHLLDFFETQCMFFESNLYGDSDLMSNDFGNSYYPYFYDNIKFDLAEYKVTPAYRLMSAETAKLYYDRIKHKELYDRNGIFLNID